MTKTIVTKVIRQINAANLIKVKPSNYLQAKEKQLLLNNRSFLLEELNLPTKELSKEIVPIKLAFLTSEIIIVEDFPLVRHRYALPGVCLFSMRITQ
jgi:hypothetical protein